ncbi:potassium voltage-gated channel unc-103-like isoform X3 [Hydractinia symbiolongicarpus]|nr:potassium voltage-gated channel unc-103-like isoform X3 [Hydractinia symbiolongicarpus]
MVISPRNFPAPMGEKERKQAERERLEAEQNDGKLFMTGIKVQAPRSMDSIASAGSRSQTSNRCNCIVYHEGRFKIIWDWMVLVLVIFTAIQIPFYAAFDYKPRIILNVVDGGVKPMVILSVIVDFMFILDIFINFRTTYIKSSSDEVVRNPRMLAKHYLKTWFTIDLLAAIPFDWIMHNRNSGSNTSTLVGLLKSARLLRLFRVARRIDRYSEYGIAVFFLLMSLFTLISHWLACGWNFIARHEEDNPLSWVRRMDATLHGEWNFTNSTISMTQSERYVASLYFVVSSLTSVGFGNIAATTETEQIFSIIVMLLGALMYACIFGNMVAIVQRLYSKASTFHANIQTVREFLKFYKIPEELRSSINNYVRREWNVSQGVDVEAVLRRFPDCIQADLTYELYQGVFNNVKPFREATVSCMRALAMRFKTITLQANTYVLRQGEGINRLYILGKGSLEVITDGDLKDIIGRYTTFGYDFTKKPKYPKSNASLRALNLVEIHYIQKDDMMEILKMYPKFAKRFRESLTLGYNLNDEKEEGYRKCIQRKHKMHITAVAKNALGLPIMARFTKSYRKKSSQSEPGESLNTFVESNQNGTRKSMSHDAILENYEPPRPIIKSQTTDIPLKRIGSDSSYNSVQFSDEELQRERKDSDTSLKSEISLENRIESLEKQVRHLNYDLDKKLTIILDLLGANRKHSPRASPTNSDYVSVTLDDAGKETDTPHIRHDTNDASNEKHKELYNARYFESKL